LGAILLHPVMETGFTGSLTIWLLLPKMLFMEEADKNY